MIESLKVSNFRCFDKLELSQLRRINIVVGKNSSGKTALLESIFIGAGNPESLIRIRQQRISTPVTVSTDRTGFESIWHHLFAQLDDTKKIAIQSRGRNANRRVEIFYDSKASATVPVNNSVSAVTPLSFFYYSGIKLSEPVKYSIGPNSEGLLQISPALPTDANLSFFPANIKHSPDEAGRRFSVLSKKGEESPIVDALRELYPQLEDLSIEVEGASSMVFASVKGLSEKLPLQVISDGVYRLMAVLIGVANTRNGIVLIDEIENGIYHRSFGEVWKVLISFSRLYNAQLFITTHSRELLESAAKSFDADDTEVDFSLLRTENGKIKQFSELSFKRAVEQHAEIR